MLGIQLIILIAIFKIITTCVVTSNRNNTNLVLIKNEHKYFEIMMGLGIFPCKLTNKLSFFVHFI